MSPAPWATVNIQTSSFLSSSGRFFKQKKLGPSFCLPTKQFSQCFQQTNECHTRSFFSPSAFRAHDEGKFASPKNHFLLFLPLSVPFLSLFALQWKDFSRKVYRSNAETFKICSSVDVKLVAQGEIEMEGAERDRNWRLLALLSEKGRITMTLLSRREKGITMPISK